MADGGNITHQYIDELVKAVTTGLELKKNASLLGLGGGDWQFGKMIAAKAEAMHFIYADDNQDQLAEADESDVLTTYCGITDAEQISSVGKYDAIILKHSFEKIAPAVSCLEDFFFAIYKALKLNGKAIMVVRIRPTIPLPDNPVNDWKEKIPESPIIMKEAEECGFQCTSTQFSAKVKLDRAQWKEELKKRTLPFMAEASDEDIDNCLSDKPDVIECDDQMEIIFLTKVIS